MRPSTHPSSAGLRTLLVASAVLSGVALVSAARLGAQDDVAAQRLLLTAEQKARAGDPAGAIADLRSLAERYPKSRAVSRALLEWASLATEQGMPREAASALSRLISEHPRAPEAAMARVREARLQAEEQGTKQGIAQARDRLEALFADFDRARYPDLPARSEALVLVGELEALLGELDSAAARYVIAIEDEPTNRFQTEARFRFARNLLWRRYEEPTAVASAVQLLQQVIEDDSARPALVAQARALVTLVDRLVLGIEQGRRPWTQVRTFSNYPLRKAVGVDAALDGTVAATDADGLVLFPSQGEPRRIPVSSAGRPAYDAAGDLLVPTETGVLRLPGHSVTSLTFSSEKPRPLEKLEAAAADPLGRIAVLDRTIDGVGMFDAHAHPITALAPDQGAVDVAIDDLGHPHVLVDKNPRVLTFDFDLKLAGGVAGDWNRPSAVDVDSLGNVYVLDRGQKRIDVIAPGGERLEQLGPVLPGGYELRAPEDIAVDGQGRLLIVDNRAENLLVVF